jgi:hypothetical protein
MKQREQKMNLRDGGKNAFLNDPLAVWTGFGARDGDRAITILVQDLAIQRVAPQIATTLAVEAQRDRFLRIANRLLRIPTKPAMHSNTKPAAHSDLKPASVPI